MFDNFTFDLVSDFPGYNSSRDKTNIREGFLVRGSQNVFKKVSGTIANRFGLKRRGIADSTLAGVVSSYEWKSGLGKEYPLRVANNKLQVESDLVTPGSPLWYDLLETSTLLNPARTLPYFTFAPWYEYLESKDRLVMVRRDANILHWSGGLTKVSGGTAAGGTGAIATYTITAPGTGYVVGDYVYLGTNGAIFRVATIGALGVITGFESTVSVGYGYVAGTTYSTTTTSNAGSGATLTVLSITTSGTLTKSDSTTSWLQDGFATKYPSEKRLIINGVEYTYSGGEDTDTIYGVMPNPSSVSANSIAIQSVIVSSTDDISGAVAPVALDSNDMVRVLEGQLFVASYTSQTIKISARTINRYLGFLDFINIGSLISGDPDFAIIDSPAKGMIPKDGKMYITGGTSDWYIITPNVPAPVAFVSPISGTTNAFIQTKVEKIPGTGLVAAISHEFIDSYGGDIVFLSQDQQVRTFSTAVKNVFTKKFPSFSQELQNELFEEDFTGGHLKTIGDFIYLTAPIAGRHYMYQIRERIDENGDVSAERVWHSPQIAGISRFAEIEGLTYGHSNQYPQIYQIWDTNQWYDDSPDDEELSYTSVARFSYSHVRGSKGGYDFVGTGAFDKTYFEGYMAEGSNVYGNVFFDYRGSTATQSIIINTVAKPAIFYTGNQTIGLGSSVLGANPLGDGLVLEPNDQSLLPKFRTICDINPQDSFENEIEVYSNEANARWELLRLGTNLRKGDSAPVEIRKSS